MTTDYTRAPWDLDRASPVAVAPPADRRTSPNPSAEPATHALDAQGAGAELTAEEYRAVAELRDRVSTRLTIEDQHYPPGPRRELTRQLIPIPFS